MAGMDGEILTVRFDYAPSAGTRAAVNMRTSAGMRMAANMWMRM